MSGRLNCLATAFRSATKAVGLVAVWLLAAAAMAQQPKLRSYVDAMQWDAEKSGPLFVLEPDDVRRKPTGTGLDAFDRKKVVVGGLTAIVPARMVIIDDSLRQSPNLYDGLPLYAKVTYLLSTLDVAQWKLVSGKGIGLGDLHGEQQAVFESILPRPFKWTSVQAQEDGGNAVAKGTLSDKDRLKVRLRIRKSLQFNLTLAGERSYSMASTSQDNGVPGEIQYSADESGELDPSEVFGVKIRQVVDNRTKPSDIDYRAAAFDLRIAFRQGEKVIDLLHRIGSATGKEFYADVRVADRAVCVFGKEARAGDLLEVLALSVTGTFREVGGAYVLTSDLAGLGARKLRLTLWQEAVRRAIDARMNEWSKSIRDSGGVPGITFDSDDPLRPNDAINKLLAKIDPRDPDSNEIGGTELSPELRAFLARFQKMYSSQQFSTDVVGVEVQFTFGFVLPDGTKLRGHRQNLFLDSAINYGPPVRTAGPQPYLPIALSPENGPIHLLLAAEDAAQAATAVQAALSHGFGELWLETRSQIALNEAIRVAHDLDVKVRLVIRPFEGRSPTAQRDLDINLLGDDASALEARKDLSPRWLNSMEFLLAGEFIPRLCLTPRAAGIRVQSSDLIALAATPGLAGVVVLGTQPRGYESQRTREHSGHYGSDMAALHELGYSLDTRKAFLRAYSIDPIDIVPPDLMFTGELRQPFFMDDRLRGLPTEYDGTITALPVMETLPNDWDQFRSKSNRQIVEHLLSRLSQAAGDLPILVEGRTAKHNLPPTLAPLVTWRAVMNLSGLEFDSLAGTGAKREGVIVSLAAISGLPTIARSLAGKGPLVSLRVVDASAVSQAELLKLLDKWFVKSPAASPD